MHIGWDFKWDLEEHQRKETKAHAQCLIWKSRRTRGEMEGQNIALPDQDMTHPAKVGE